MLEGTDRETFEIQANQAILRSLWQMDTQNTANTITLHGWNLKALNRIYIEFVWLH